MRFSRAVAVVGLVVVVALAAGWGPTGSAHANRHSRPAAGTLGSLTIPPALRRRLLESLNQRLAPRLPVRPVPLAPGLPQPRTCYVAGGGCSLTPCVQFATGASPVVSQSNAIVLRLAAPARTVGGPQTARGRCQGRLGMPKVLRVSAIARASTF
jgi:hypothetical protein